jgi:membrane fusion protein (multidrug efflux system)
MRYVYAILGLLVVIGGLAAIKAKQIGQLISFGKQYEVMGPPPEVVSSAVATSAQWEGTLSAVGSIVAAKGVTVSNDAPGVVARIHFESGQSVKQGQVLVELDSSVEQAQLASAAARTELASISLKRTRALVDSNSIAASQLDTDQFGYKGNRADATALAAQINRKTVRAPFSGRLGIREVNLGQYLNSGTTISVLEAIDTVFVDFALPQQELGELSVGMPVRVTMEGLAGPLPGGTISALDPEIDAMTRTVKVRASIPNKDERLRPGMFVSVAVVLPKTVDVVAVPATSIIHASYGDSVFVIEDKKDEQGAPVNGADGKPAKVARQQFVRVGRSRGDFVAIDDGVKAGEEVVSSGAFKLRNGSGVVVDNTINLDPKLDPHPVNH